MRSLLLFGVSLEGRVLSMRLAAALVHLFTASGIVCALLAVMAFIGGRYEVGFLWLGVALVIDGIDGTFARAAKVAERLPCFSGETLDLVVDYVTYVFVPVVGLLLGGRLGGGAPSVLLASAMLLSSLYHFSDTRSKDADHHFVGFPAVWNLVAFYVFALGLSVSVTAVLVVMATALTFVPWPWVHPLRVVEARALTLVVTVVWGLAALATVLGGFPASLPLGVCLLGCAGYAVGLSLWWHCRRRSRSRAIDTA